MTDIYAFMRMALETARKAAELTAQAELRLDLQPVVVCLSPVVAIVEVPLGYACATGGELPVPGANTWPRRCFGR